MSQTINLTLPTSRQPVTDSAGFMTIPWYRYFQNSQSTNNNFVSIPSGTILGNDSGSQGAPSAIGIGSGLSLSNGVLSAVSSFSGTTDNVPEGTHNLYFTNLRAQDAIGQILSNDANITFSYARGSSITANLTTVTPTTGGTLQATAFDTYGRINKTQAITWATAGSVAMAYNSSTNTVSASLNTTGVTAGTYGSSTQSPVITVNAQGQITAASNTTVTPAWSSITSTPTTLAGYGITNGVTTSTQVIAGTGLAGGGALSGNVTLTLASQAASTLLGNPSTSSGIPSAITIGSGLSLSTGGVLSATGGGGSVTSVGLSSPSEFTVSGSPVTTSGTLTFTKASQTANQVWAAPNGSNGAPSFRALVSADIPSLSYVTSVAMSVPSFLSVAGSPITSSGTLAVSLATQSANTVFAGPSSGSAAAPTFRSLQASDISQALPPGYIDGFILSWNSATSISSSSGTCQVANGTSISSVSTLTLSGLSLSASTQYHVYAYLNSGTPAIECVTTAPASAYNGTARAKTGDNSRRYLGSVLTNASSQIFYFQQNGNRISLGWGNAGSAPQRALNSGTATTATTVTITVPITATHATLRFVGDSTASARIANSLVPGATGSTGVGTNFSLAVAPGTTPVVDTQLDNNQSILYWFASTPSIGLSIDVFGYLYER
jgi:hypothetical protein